jgi:hypothetical protein
LKKEIFDQSVNVSVEDDGGVRCTFNHHNKLDELDVCIKVYAGEFLPPDQIKEDGALGEEKYRDFNTTINFSKFAKKNALKSLKAKLAEFKYKVDIEMQQQSLLAPVLRNKKKLNHLNKKITIIEEKMQNTVFSQVFD